MPHFFCTFPHFSEEIDAVVTKGAKKRETVAGDEGRGRDMVRLTVQVEPGFRETRLLAIDNKSKG